MSQQEEIVRKGRGSKVTEAELVPLVDMKEEDEDNSGCCIIVVGSTGTGKSSTVGKITGAKTKSGSGHERVTTQCEIHRSLSNDNEPVWVDTVGWDDAECEDDDTFKDILRFIDQYNITRVKAVIWNVVPNVRRDALLTGQARLINLFKEGDIWDNVVVVAKQSLNPEVDCQGAVKAAQLYTDKELLHIGYRFHDDPTVSAAQRDSFRNDQARSLFNVKTDEEIRSLIKEKLSQVGPAVQVVFKTRRCLDCSASGDQRLLPSHCHMESHFIHQGKVEKHHPDIVVKFHPSQHHIMEHDGRLRKRWYMHMACGNLNKKRFSCCGRRSGKEGCQRKWACCKALWEEENVGGDHGCSTRYRCCGASTSHATGGCEPRYSCCGKQVDDQGCNKVCKKCGGDWGGPAGQCFKKEHCLVNIGEEVQQEADVEEEVVEEEEEEEANDIASLGEKVEKKKLLKKENMPQIITYHLF